jgi:hypothetical protein
MSGAVHAGLRPLTRLIIVLIVLSPFAFAVPHWIDGGPDYISEWDEEAVVVIAPLPPRERGTRMAVDARRPLTGFAINAHHIGDLNLYLDSVDAIAEMGANALIVLTPMFQERIDSSDIRFVSDKCATDEQLIAILKRGREHGLHTTLLPIVLIELPGERDWRGVIKPKDWDRWWETYEAFTDRFVNVANTADVDMLVVGSELNSTEGMLDRWQGVIERVHDEFKGEIAYSANWDRYEKIKFWPMLDVMCVSSYFELRRDDPEAAEDDLVEAWANERDRLLRFAEKWEKPLLLSEVGYPSVPWASAHPWNYVVDKGSTADHEAQARCWRAFFRAWTQIFADPELPAAGFFGYCWSPYYHGDDWDTGYGIKGKPAYDIVRRGMANVRSEAAENAEAGSTRAKDIDGERDEKDQASARRDDPDPTP